jgi:hypothetical protein
LGLSIGKIFLLVLRAGPTQGKELSMTHLPSLRLAISLGLVLSACNTEEIAPHQVAVQTTQSDPGQGALFLYFTYTDATYTAEQARASTNPSSTEYHLFVDGREVVYDNLGSAVPAVVLEGGGYSAGYWSAGAHHFELAAPNGPTIFAADGPIVGDAVNRLYLFGPLDALQARFTSYAFTPPAGSEHASVINLMRNGESIELVNCTDDTHCTVASPSLALGETFEGDFPLVASDSDWLSLSTAGAGLGYRLVPSASLPAPHINPLEKTNMVAGHSVSVFTPPANFIGAPIYMSTSPEGYVLAEVN